MEQSSTGNWSPEWSQTNKFQVAREAVDVVRRQMRGVTDQEVVVALTETSGPPIVVSHHTFTEE